ncbi:aminotransferase class V-fold PLP-dependent enzyme [Rhodohalobacter sulfatireducens]|uniref:Aminotransferase class V-fold PLP-dependent enzyme n=1 Tax=Rhodohalobacter sulfatireducens TaxID=2911366 RepID=A0ABS9KH68_9BACT|nr:aminotransferase class V-fold PLP-dependent enzyme [Rhodohalobacter sulfatireducens]MCG2590199.1 aminotransferase class V-fold PLP-dependent enzyme [Rhodohalobacter sulfatireducens]
MNKTEIRTIFPHTSKEHIYLNHAAISPMSDRVKHAIEQFLADRNSGNIDNFEKWMELTQETRDLISELIGTQNSDHITFMGNTSDALSAVAKGIDWNKGDEIILNTMEFPSNIQPFRILENLGVKMVYLEPDEAGRITPEIIENAITSKTKMVSISFVQYLNGFRADLKSIGEICKANGIYFVVDGIQGLGAMPLSVQDCNIDALASGCHKWLMSPMGISFLYLSEKLSNNMKPYKTGWLSVEEPWEMSEFNKAWLPVSQHLETGTYNLLGIVGLHASLKYLLEIGIEAVQFEILKHSNFLISKLSNKEDVVLLTPNSPHEHAGIVTFKRKGEKSAEKIVNDLISRKITISARKGFIRISPHYYNTEEELQTALEAIF